LGKTDEARKAFFDIHCITSKEEWFIIEMQVAKQEHFLDRCLFYSATQNIILIELPGFKKTLQESGNKIDRWLYCFKHLGRLKNRPEELSGKIFERLFEEAEINKLTPEGMELYNKSITKDRDVRNMMDYSRKEGREKGIEKGREEGIKNVAKNLLDLRLPVNDIAKATGLTPEQILCCKKHHFRTCALSLSCYTDFKKVNGENSSDIRKINYICGGNGLAAVYIQHSSGQDTLYYIHTDYQGSLIALSLPNGTVAERYAYDPWGNRRNPADWAQTDTRTAFIIAIRCTST
jgi:hypothetical protein